MITQYRGSTRSALACRRGSDRFESRLNTASFTFLTKDVKKSSYCYYVRCATLIVRVGEMPWPKTGVTHYQAKLGLLRQGSCNQRVSCLMGVT